MNIWSAVVTVSADWGCVCVAWHGMRPVVEEIIKGGISEGTEGPPKKFTWHPLVNGGRL